MEIIFNTFYTTKLLPNDTLIPTPKIYDVCLTLIIFQVPVKFEEMHSHFPEPKVFPCKWEWSAFPLPRMFPWLRKCSLLPCLYILCSNASRNVHSLLGIYSVPMSVKVFCFFKRATDINCYLHLLIASSLYYKVKRSKLCSAQIAQL